ncbi:hypothetical protein N7G274_008058 [Stereocaulon virgatum]|uniref:Uncharacterized protein n=1 Tax=Stereocaulon virgatum TaxID=373712 RepID=A0ABR4A2V6_9LECA
MHRKCLKRPTQRYHPTKHNNDGYHRKRCRYCQDGKKIAALQQQLDDQNITTPEETDGSKTLKTAHEECNDTVREKDAEIQSLKAMHEGCDEVIESLTAEIKSMAAQAKIDKNSLAQNDDLTHVRILTNAQRLAEDLDAEVKQLRRTLERIKRELADATKHSGTEAASPQNELQDSPTQLTQPKVAQNLGDVTGGLTPAGKSHNVLSTEKVLEIDSR